MGFFSANDLDGESAQLEFAQSLLTGEVVLAAFRFVRDSVVLTDQRLLYVDVQGLTGSKISYTSIPWRSVVRFSVETAGTLDLDADLKVWVSGSAGPIEVKISRRSDPARIHRILSEQVLAKR